MVNQRITWGG